MDRALFLQRLRDLPIEEGRAYLSQHLEELSDHTAIGELMAEEALRVLYTPMLSLKLAELLIYYRELTGHLPSHALGLKSKGNALFQINHCQAAIDALDAAGDEFLLLDDEMNWARSRISWILAAAWLGHVNEALSAAARARAIFARRGEYYWVAVIDSNTGMIYENIGRFQDALDLYDGMLAILPEVKDQSETFVRRSIAITEVNEARLLTWLGRFDQAYLLQQKALKSFHALGEQELVTRVAINLAHLDYTLGYYGSALRRYYQIQDVIIQREGDDPLSALRLAELRLCIANCLLKLSRAQEARAFSEEATSIYRSLGTSLNTGKALRDHASVLIASGNSKDALAVLDEAWNLFHQGGFAPLAVITRLQQAELLKEAGSLDEAYDSATLVRRYCQTNRLAAYAVGADLLIVGVLTRKAQLLPEIEQRSVLLEQAIRLCKRVIQQSKKQNLQEELYKSHYLLGQMYLLQGKDDEAGRKLKAAIDQIDDILNDLVYDLSPSFLHTSWQVYGDMIALCLKQGQTAQAFSYLERARSLTLRQYLSTRRRETDAPAMRKGAASGTYLRVEAELRDWQEKYRRYSTLLAELDTSISPELNVYLLQAELEHCETNIRELFERQQLHSFDSELAAEENRPAGMRARTGKASGKAKEIDPTPLQKHLSPGQLLLAYYLEKDRLILFALTTEGITSYVQPGGVGQLEYLLPLLHAHLRPEIWPDPQHPPQQVVRRLLRKLYDLLIAPAASLLPSNGGNLIIVPYGSLHKLPFHALYDGEHFLIERLQVSYLPASSLLLQLHGDSEPDAANQVTKPPLVLGYSGHQRIQRVHDEAQVIAEMLHGKCYLEHEATISRLMEEAPNSPLIHLATHGKSRLDAPNFSYVRLADGQLNAIDAFSMNLKGCELVTLSGCETGLALSSGGDEQLGLGRAFLAAGATSLAMSLWPVEDNATSELMRLFYEHLLQGVSKAQALRAAQQALIRDEQRGYAHPYFWAAFRLVGDTSPLRAIPTQEISSARTQPLKK